MYVMANELSWLYIYLTSAYLFIFIYIYLFIHQEKDCLWRITEFPGKTYKLHKYGEYFAFNTS